MNKQILALPVLLYATMALAMELDEQKKIIGILKVNEKQKVGVAVKMISGTVTQYQARDRYSEFYINKSVMPSIAGLALWVENKYFLMRPRKKNQQFMVLGLNAVETRIADEEGNAMVFFDINELKKGRK